MTDYNIDFLIAGLVFLIFLLIHFQRYKRLNNISGRMFWFLIIAGIFDIIFDLLSSILLVKSNPAYNSWMIFFSTMLYILQMIVVYIFFNYTQALRHCNEDIRTRNIKIMAVPILCMELVIVTNVFHKQFFYCNAQGQYVHGKVYYQPLYDLKEKRYRTMEALSRLRHPSLGMISPEVFIGIAEKHGQIAKLGYLQFRKVCKFIKEHPQIMDKIESIKYNLSPLELLKSGYSKKLICTIEEFDIPFSYFQFEITETVATEYSEALYLTIADFRKSGIQICLDDFGSGYANLNTVLKLPFSTIKLDRSLLKGICYDDQVALLYKNIVAVMQNLGHKVVAEGVETQEEINLLKQWGVDLVQGYYYTKPLDTEQIIHELEKDV